MGGGSGGGGEMEVDSEQVQVDVISSAKEAEKDFHVVLFYQYADVPEQTDKSKEVKVTADPSNLQELENWVQRKCTEHSLLGRVVLASEGINGNLASFGGSNVAKFCKELQALSIFKNHPIDFKMDSSSLKPFPDLHISIKREICSTGNTMPKSLLDSGLSGTHLSPEEFHGVLDEYWGKKKQDKELVVIDVRNDVEYKTGRFMGDEQGSEAVNPNTKTFSRWAPDYAKKVADDLKSKKVLMYCTGGIRCEKASAYLKSLGVEDVSQLSGGIHRYLEKFGSNGYFKGSNFVFDSRTLQTPDGAKVVGRCYACDGPSQEVTCDRCCAVCRQPVLVCDSCRVKLYGVYYCDVHTDMAGLYEPFLERFEIEELQAQKEGLLKLLKGKLKATTRRRPIGKQVKRIETWIERKKSQRQTEEATGKTVKKSKWGSNPRCRSCGMIGPDSLLSLMGRDFSDQSVLCDGNCVGFVRDSYENPRKTLDEMNDPAFCAPTKKRKRTQKTHREFAKRMRQETEKEYAETRYNIVAFPVNEDDLESNAMQMLRCVEPYYFQYQTHVKKRWWNRKLLEMYSSEFSGHETVHYQKAIEMGLIRVNGERSDPNRVLQNGDIITNWVHRHEPPVYYIPTQDMIVYDSPRLLVINKPASLTIHPSGSFRRNSVTFILAVEAGLHNLYPVHRLDRFTSGMVLIAKDPEYAKMIMEAMVRKTVGGDEAENADGQMVESRVQKAYLARVKGKFPSTLEEVVAVQQTKKVFPKVRGSGESSTSGRSGCSSITGVEGEVYLDAVSIRPRGLYFEAADTEDPMLSLNLPIDPSKKSSASSNSHLVFSWPMQQVCQHTGTWRCYDPEVPLPAESTTVHNEDARPKSSMTRMRLIAYDPESDTSLVQCEPVTGRTHQLRVHLSYLGFPILNDPIYGENGDLFAGKTIRDEPDTSVVFEQLALPDDKQLEELADSEDMKALAKSFCVSCSLGMGMAFREVQMRRQGIDLHAYRYIVKLPDGSTEDHHTSMPFFSKPFVR